MSTDLLDFESPRTGINLKKRKKKTYIISDLFDKAALLECNLQEGRC